jgi:hypothetical protein
MHHLTTSDHNIDLTKQLDTIRARVEVMISTMAQICDVRILQIKINVC